jgi:DNA-directed RNA polymerase specialized sigma24 family protein
MRRRDDQGEGNRRPTRPESARQNNAPALQRVLDDSAEELLWLAEVMAGSRPAGEQCLADAIELAEAAQCVGPEWMLSWVRRLLVHVVLKRISSEIRELLPPAGARSSVTVSRADASKTDREKLLSIPPHRIIGSFDVLERTCFALCAYLHYPVLDCALLLGCPRGWIEPVCERVLTKITEANETAQDGFRDLNSFISAGVRECAG